MGPLACSVCALTLCSVCLASTVYPPQPCHSPEKCRRICRDCTRDARLRSVFVPADRVLLQIASNEAVRERERVVRAATANSASTDMPSASSSDLSNSQVTSERVPVSTPFASEHQPDIVDDHEPETKRPRTRGQARRLASSTNAQVESSSSTSSSPSSSSSSESEQIPPLPGSVREEFRIFFNFYSELDGLAIRFELFDADDLELWESPLPFSAIFVLPSARLACWVLDAYPGMFEPVRPAEHLTRLDHPNAYGPPETVDQVEFSMW